MNENTIRYPLKSPLTAEGIDSVTLREPVVDDMIAVEDLGAGETAGIAHLLARMSGIPFETFRKISSRDAHAMKRLADKKWGNADADGGTVPP